MAAARTIMALALAALLCALAPAAAAAGAERSSYVVYLGQHAHGAALGTHGAEELAALERDAADAHYELLAGVLGGEATRRDLRVPQPGRQLHTTRSWQFLGLAGPGGAPRGGAWRKARFGADTIIGNFDTEIIDCSNDVLADGSVQGQSLSMTTLPEKTSYKLIDSAKAGVANATTKDAHLCMIGALDPAKVKGKIVVCLRGINPRVAKGEAVKQAGGAGMVLANDASTGNEIIADAHVLPATQIKYRDGLRLYSYINSTKNPTGFITKPATILGTKPAPFMAAFSSQGPNTITPEILKPDITAPGVSVIAAWTRANSPTDLAFDLRRVAFNSESVTSMSCPHVSGVVGLLRTLHPEWSPAAIKSAIMTTALEMDNKGELILNASSLPSSPFGFGAGHVSPARTMNPGLVYDLGDADYLDFLCALKYNGTVMAMFNGAPYTYPGEAPRRVADLNYPSITVVNVTTAGATARRRVKNVGKPGTYWAFVTEPAGVDVTVTPNILEFRAKGEEKGFEVNFQVNNAALAKDYSFGALVWTNGKQFVRSPLVVKAMA
ncbi:subtilisin-like protease SBT5.3 isoform X2 [Panicum miliaceum]|uniref:Subtilisin-like protease SBT5.3 isoform X2 n=1 Tax=Panicum miliaceum TaxID=4540 RepID=A0A3L6QK09_PANMI|nr:subtilisin-like protease SBT5.3 isoform X2 [Panicum miliaceum]